jgi:hypothetical protein
VRMTQSSLQFSCIGVLTENYGQSSSEQFRRTASPVAVQLIEGFIRYEARQESLEFAQDAVRQSMAQSHSECAYGAYTGVEQFH